MKKLLALLLVCFTIFACAACGKAPADVVAGGDVEIEATETPDASVSPEATEEAKKPEDTDKNDKAEKPSASPSVAPSASAESTTAPSEKPSEKPTQTPAQTEKPVENKTVGSKLAADFKAKAGSAKDALSLAESIVSNPIIPFMAASMPVEPGLLSGFDNAEIKGFKEGAMFGPMIGSVPFIGYVFELEDGVSAQNFISTLKANANLRWNICVEAEEMVTASAGNKVFFVMCPKEFDAE